MKMECLVRGIGHVNMGVNENNLNILMKEGVIYGKN